MLILQQLFLVMETIQTGASVAKRIMKKSKFFCIVFKEVVSCFFQAIDIFFHLGSTEFLQNKIPWIGRFFSPNPWKIQFLRIVPDQIPTQWLLPFQLLAPVQRRLSLSLWTALLSRQMKGSVFKC